MITSICNVNKQEQKKNEDILIQFAKDKSSIAILFPNEMRTKKFVEIYNSSRVMIYSNDLGYYIKSIVIKINELTQGIYVLNVFNEDNLISQQFYVN